MHLAVVREADVDLQLRRVPLGPSRRTMRPSAWRCRSGRRHRGHTGPTAAVGSGHSLGLSVRSTRTRSTQRRGYEAGLATGAPRGEPEHLADSWPRTSGRALARFEGAKAS